MNAVKEYNVSSHGISKYRMTALLCTIATMNNTNIVRFKVSCEISQSV